MSEQQIRMGKIIVLATWLFAAASFFFPFYYWPTGPLMRAIFGILLAVHFVELGLVGLRVIGQHRQRTARFLPGERGGGIQ